MERRAVHGIWLDDVRPMPKSALMDVHVRNFSEFRAALNEIKAHGEQIDFISFDYMLHDFPDPNWPPPYEKNGKDCARLLCMYDEILHPDFHYEHHSSDNDLGNSILKALDMFLERVKRKV